MTEAARTGESAAMILRYRVPPCRTTPRAILAIGAIAAALGLAGCAEVGLMNPLSSRAAPVPAAQAPPNGVADSRGVVSYATYQVAIAREGDTVDSVASRLGTTASALALRNALPLDYRMRAGEVLLLPDDVARASTGFGAGEISERPLGWTPEGAAAAIDGAGPGAGQPPRDNPFQNGQTEPLIDPVRHRVEAGETAYSIARLYGVSVTALASWNGLGSDLAVRENQELLIPIVSGANQITGAPDTQPGEGTPVTPPPSAAGPLPDDIVAAANPASPDLGQLRTPAGGRLAAPVDAPVARAYDTANPNGIGYAADAGTPVRAAAAGEVALISQELGGQGTIVLVRHADDLMTTYSTLDEVSVAKGDTVGAGQVLGVVAARGRTELQFDVFRGTASVDPTPYLGG